MSGLILSKAASEYATRLRTEGISTETFIATDSPQLIKHTDKEHIEWLLAEPALAIEVLDDLPNLRWLQSTWAGVERLVAHPRRSYALTNIRGIFAPLMREYVLAYCLAHEREILAHHAAQSRQEWRNANTGVMRGKTMLIMGVGSIGQGIAHAAQFMGLTTLGVARTPRAINGLDEIGCFTDLPRLLARADYVVNTLPNTPETQDVINSDFLHHMKSSAILINVGRGQAVVEADLAQALHEGIIAAAVLDVYRTEPLPPDHVFWHTPNLTLTSHTAAPSFPAEVFEIFIENYRRFVRGDELVYSVNFEQGY